MSEKIEACPAGHEVSDVLLQTVSVGAAYCCVCLKISAEGYACDWRGPTKATAGGAVTAWNHRPQLTALQAQLEVARNAQEIAARSDGENTRKLQGADIRIAELQAQLAESEKERIEAEQPHRCAHDFPLLGDGQCKYCGVHSRSFTGMEDRLAQSQSALAEAERKVEGLEGQAREFQGLLDKIARAVGMDDWDYPGQIIRAAEALVAERDAAREELGKARAQQVVDLSAVHAHLNHEYERRTRAESDLSAARARVAELEAQLHRVCPGCAAGFELVDAEHDRGEMSEGPRWLPCTSAGMADRDRLAGELEALRELDKSTLSCGHNACFAKTDDGGKTGICTVCKVETLSARVRELESGAPAKPTDAP